MNEKYSIRNWNIHFLKTTMKTVMLVSSEYVYIRFKVAYISTDDQIQMTKSDIFLFKSWQWHWLVLTICLFNLNDLTVSKTNGLNFWSSSFLSVCFDCAVFCDWLVLLAGGGAVFPDWLADGCEGVSENNAWPPVGWTDIASIKGLIICPNGLQNER